MEVFDAVRTLLAVRQFSDRPVSDDLIERVVESAHLSGSSMNLQPWHFVVVKSRAGLERLGSLVKTGPYTAAAAFAVVVAIERDSRFGASDGSRAIQNMMLTAWSEGVGSNWTGFSGMELHDALAIPDNYDVLAVVPFGYPMRKLGSGKKKRKPLDEVASLEKYREPFP